MPLSLDCWFSALEKSAILWLIHVVLGMETGFQDGNSQLVHAPVRRVLDTSAKNLPIPLQQL